MGKATLTARAEADAWPVDKNDDVIGAVPALQRRHFGW